MSKGFEKTGFEGGFIWMNGAMLPYCDVMGEECEKYFKEGTIYILAEQEATNRKQITWLQMKSLYLYLTKLANALNDAGHDMRVVFNSMRQGTSVSCTQKNLKLCVWDQMMMTMFGHTSIKQLDTKETQELYENVNRFSTERLGVHVPWPDEYGHSLEKERERQNNLDRSN